MAQTRSKRKASGQGVAETPPATTRATTKRKAFNQSDAQHAPTKAVKKPRVAVDSGIDGLSGLSLTGISGMGASRRDVYDESEEKDPDHAAYSEDFRTIQKECSDLVTNLRTFLGTHAGSSSRAKKHHEKAKELIMPAAKNLKIGLLGDTGVGKSSLLNSIVGMPNIAKSGSSGSSCTYVPTEYCGPFHGQTTKFHARIRYIDRAATKPVFRKLIDDYEEMLSPPEGSTREDMIGYNLAAASAVQTLRSLFCDHVEFKDEAAGREFLRDNFEQNGNGALEKFVEWAQKLLEDENRPREVGADNQVAFTRMLGPLISGTINCARPSLWPLVRSVQVGVKDTCILDTVTLVDLPGVDDTNQVRARAVNSVHNECDEFWIVANISRAATNKKVHEWICRYVERGSRLALVLTGIDDGANDKLAEHWRELGDDLKTYDDLLEDIDRLRVNSALTDSLIASKMGMKSSAKLLLEIQAHITERDVNARALKEKLLERLKFLVEKRNSKVMKDLRSNANGSLPVGTNFNIFCVSNTHYDACKGVGEHIEIRLSAKDTGIPAIRTYLKEQAAPAKVLALDAFVNHVARFVEKCRWWSQDPKFADFSVLLSTIEGFQERVDNAAKDLGAKLFKHCMDLVGNDLVERNPQFAEAAVAEWEEKGAWPYPTLRAYMRRDGIHSTPKKLDRNWNEEFAKAVRIHINQGSWTAFLNAVQEDILEAEKECVGVIDEIRKQLNDHPASQLIPEETVNGLLVTYEKDIRTKFESFRGRAADDEEACSDEDITKELKNIRSALVDGQAGGYVMDAMAEAYHLCSIDPRGKGVKQRYLAIFRTHLELKDERSPFSMIMTTLEAAIREHVENSSGDLGQEVRTIVGKAHGDLKDQFDAKTETDDEKAVRKELEKLLKKKWTGVNHKFNAITAGMDALKHYNPEA